MEIIKLTEENTKRLPLFMLDIERRRREIEQKTGKKTRAVLTLDCDL